MKDLFPGYYLPDQNEIRKLWEDCIFVLDTNVLLNLYRYTPETRDILMNILSKISERNRLWIPHQVALEYQENRLGEILRQEEVYSKISETLQDALVKISELMSRGHLAIDVQGLIERLLNTFSEIENELEETRKQHHPDLFSHDIIREKITSILDGKVGQPYTQDRLREISKIGDERYASYVPPGYGDQSKKGVTKRNGLIIEDKYGDLIIWYQIIDKVKEIEKPIIFITDDVKDDWWWKFDNKRIGPRTELTAEIKKEAGVSFYTYTPDQFMEYAKNFFNIDVTQTALDEVREVTAEKRTWRDEVVDAFESLGGEALLSAIYEHIEQTSSRRLPASWKAIIRKTIEENSSDTDTYKGKEDLFYSIGGLGSGHWGLRRLKED